MAEQPFLYSLDERPPLWRTIIYGLQWALIMFPALVIIASIAAEALHLSVEERVSFFQKILLLSGIFTLLQTLRGHRYPLQEGPATALLLTFVVLAPQGLGAIQGGFLCGGLLLLVAGGLRWMRRLVAYFTPNVVGVILMLIAFTLVPYLLPRLVGITPEHPLGEGAIFGAALGLVLVIAVMASRLKGFLQSTAMILGICVGSVVFWFWGRMDLQPVREASWVSFPGSLWMGMPRLSFPAVISSALAYLAVAVNSVGSIHGVAAVVGEEDIPDRVDRGLAVTGLAGVAASVLGVVGTVSYATSPGVILVTRVASRYALSTCGVILIVAALVPRLSALFAAVPPTVIGAALCVALASQVGAAMTAITAGGRSLAARDYLVVGLPVMIGTLVAATPSAFFSALPTWIGTIVGNGLVLGIVLVLLLEHVLLPTRA
jgi:xanthine/uracil permease